MFTIVESEKHFAYNSVQELTLKSGKILMAFLKSQDKRKVITIIYLVRYKYCKRKHKIIINYA